MSFFRGRKINISTIENKEILISDNDIPTHFIRCEPDDIHFLRQFLDNLDDKLQSEKFANSNLSPYAPDDWLPEDDLNNNLLGC